MTADPTTRSSTAWSDFWESPSTDDVVVHIYPHRNQWDPYEARWREFRLAKLWLLLPVLMAVFVVAFVSVLLFTPLLKPSAVRRRDIFVSDSAARVGSSAASSAANATASAVEDSTSVDSDRMSTFVVELRPAHFWPNSTVGPLASLVVHSAASSARRNSSF
ncbi:uncharacterized protein [Dermacentor albipictus]|uniref:uncharacterized protein n=1 Tax=Dermacentor albipictus TaxID=60249 RepID=UPI0038FCCC83